MRELELMPAWYPQARRKKRIAILLSWGWVVCIAGMGLGVAVAQQNVRSEEESLIAIHSKLEQTKIDLRKLDDLIEIQRQNSHQMRVIADLGTHIEVSRLLNCLELAMPQEMAVIELSIDVQNTEVRNSGLGRARTERDKETPAPERRVRARLLGVVPTDADLANFLAGLSNVEFLNNVAMAYAKDRADNGRVMREFEVTFTIDLTTPTPR